MQRRLKELFVDICSADPSQNWAGAEKYDMQFKQRKAGWYRRMRTTMQGSGRCMKTFSPVWCSEATLILPVPSLRPCT